MSEKIYALLVRLYPSHFREAYVNPAKDTAHKCQTLRDPQVGVAALLGVAIRS
jgi:hypothetical protein